MKKRLSKFIREGVLTLLIAVGVMTAYNLYLQRNMPSGDVPVLMGTTLDGSRFNLGEASKDETVLVYFWASWCSVCRVVSPAVSDIASDYPVISVAMASGNDDRVSRYLAAHTLDFATINDEGGMMVREWGVQATPAFAIVKNGEIRSVTTGYTTELGLRLRMMLL
ncbi:protein disulfide oxidoreductase [Kistimonas asteriae]|uniref:protein disulfide oxidoreductase n=1 Tax=Kistimonas asteriae TaxID=517724 RepID=UPI001BAC3251|nr:protein disulfide oxidoreductase [Kistimonas asteriae]